MIIIIIISICERDRVGDKLKSWSSLLLEKMTVDNGSNTRITLDSGTRKVYVKLHLASNNLFLITVGLGLVVFIHYNLQLCRVIGLF